MENEASVVSAPAGSRSKNVVESLKLAFPYRQTASQGESQGGPHTIFQEVHQGDYHGDRGELWTVLQDPPHRLAHRPHFQLLV